MVSHPVVLRGLGFDAASGAPVVTAPRAGGGGKSPPAIVKTTDDEFVEAFLARLATQEGRLELSAALQGGGSADAPLALFQPVHRTFYIAVLELACDPYGERGLDPRVDPATIDSAGLVIRRVAEGGAAHSRERWVRRGGRVMGWMPVPPSGRAGDEHDPDPARRRSPLRTGDPALNKLLDAELGLADPYEERAISLFPAPPEVCKALGRTVLFGVIQVASAERVEGPPSIGDGFQDDEEVRALVPTFFQALSENVTINLGKIAGKTLSAADARPPAGSAVGPDLDQYVGMLQQLVVQLNAFQHAKMREALKGILLPVGGEERPAVEVLERAAKVLVYGLESEGGQALTTTVPSSWPVITEEQARRVLSAAKEALGDRLRSIMPQEGRFDAPGRLYEVRAFARVRRDDGCPPELVWSAPSAPFTILPWYEKGELPPPLIQLPAVTKDALKSFTPNVAFAVPKSVFNFLGANKPVDLFKGQGSDGGEKESGWICGFNIPIITLCAFIVLNIFLTLLNIIFFWLPFIKICIPIPLSLKKKLPSG